MKSKHFFSLVILVIAGFTVKAQQLPLYSQYMMNGFLLNPAMAGSVSYVPVCLTVREQWAKIDGAPNTMAVSGHTKLGRSEGVGGYIYNDNFGPIKRTGLLASYAHHFQVGTKPRVALGVSLSAFQFTLDATKLDFKDNVSDPVLGADRQKESAIVPDANFGAYLYQDDKYFAGVSIAQLFQFNIKLGTTNNNNMVRHYYILGGYKFDLNKDFKLEPSMLIKATGSAPAPEDNIGFFVKEFKGSPAQMDLNCKGYYKKNYWLGFSFRSDKSLIALLGMKYSIFYIGYAFDYSLGKISNSVSGGSHEILIGVNFGEKENRGSSLL